MAERPETVLQFGAGRFLSAFFDLFVEDAHASAERSGRTAPVGSIVVVQSTPGDRARRLTASRDGFGVLVRGLERGAPVERLCRVRSVSRALVAEESWAEVLDVARSPALRHIVSNTTERGYETEPGESLDEAPPASFPLALLAVLRERFRAGLPGVTLLPCELVERNGERLRTIVLEAAERRDADRAFLEWLREACRWHSTLVDRIVTSPEEPRPPESGELVAVAEPFALFAIQTVDGELDLFDHPAVVPTGDVEPYALRKVRVLNGAHTALVARALPAGFETVREAVEDPEIGRWLRSLLFDEIVPVIAERVDDAAGFAETTLERFRNPFLNHRLRDIALYHEDKIAARLEPTRREYVERFARQPSILSELCR